MLTESIQESVTAWGGEILKSDARERGDIRPETEAMTGDDWKEMLLSTIEHTFYGTALIGGMGPATQFYGDAKRANAATQMVQAYKTLGETAKESTTRTDTPSRWTEFVSRLSDAGQNKTIQIEATKFKEYFQSQGMDIDQVASTLGVTPEAMKEGAEITGFIDVPLKGYLETIAPTEHHNALIKDLRTDSEQFTAREAEAFYANEKEAMKTIEGAAETIAGSYSQDEQVCRDPAWHTESGQKSRHGAAGAVQSGIRRGEGPAQQKPAASGRRRAGRPVSGYDPRRQHPDAAGHLWPLAA
jgi:hypothetical protein